MRDDVGPHRDLRPFLRGLERLPDGLERSREAAAPRAAGLASRFDPRHHHGMISIARWKPPVAAPTLALAVMAVGACGPSIDPAAKADIDRRVGLLQAGTTAVPAPTVFEPMPLAAGQWSQYKMIDDKGQPSFMTYKILAEEGGAFWLETVRETYTGRMMQKMLVAFGDRRDPTQIEIRAIKTKDAKGNVNELPPAMMPLLQSTYRGIVSGMVVHWQGLPQEGTTVPAGRFDGCFHVRSEAQWGPWKSVADNWAHPAVPLSGSVRVQGVDHPFSMELVAFGLRGATDDF